LSAPAHYLSACAVYRDEGPYLREWIAFHRLMGVERFYLYNNRSSDDGHREALAPYVDEGVVVLHEWPDCLPANVVTGEAVQTATFQHCLQNYGDRSRWITFLDLDEFLFSPSGRPLPEVLREYERWPGVGVNWAVYGPSGHRSMPSGPVIENFVRRTDEREYNRHIKSIADPRRVQNFCLAHFFVYHGDLRFAVDENHRPIDGRPLSKTAEVSFERLRVNHYQTKSEEEMRRKLSRVRVDNGRPWELTEEQIARRLKVLDAVEDRTIQMYLPALRAELERVEARALAEA
jgi:hypothetical protein